MTRRHRDAVASVLILALVLVAVASSPSPLGSLGALVMMVIGRLVYDVALAGLRSFRPRHGPPPLWRPKPPEPARMRVSEAIGRAHALGLSAVIARHPRSHLTATLHIRRLGDQIEHAAFEISWDETVDDWTLPTAAFLNAAYGLNRRGHDHAATD